MAFTYGGDPANSDREMVRYLCGDTIDRTSDGVSLTDAEVDASLSNTAVSGVNKTLMAAIECCEALAARWAYYCDTSNTGGLSVKASQRSEAYAKRADMLRARVANDAFYGATPLFPAKDEDFHDGRRADTSEVQPGFSRGMFDYPTTWPYEVED